MIDDHNLMASTFNPLSCDNSKDVLQHNGFNSYPQEYCISGKIFTKPPDEVFISPGFIGIGDQNTKFGVIGVSVGYIKSVSSTIGITIDAGYHMHNKTNNSYKNISNLLNIAAGVTWFPGGEKIRKACRSPHMHRQGYPVIPKNQNFRETR